MDNNVIYLSKFTDIILINNEEEINNNSDENINSDDNQDINNTVNINYDTNIYNNDITDNINNESNITDNNTNYNNTNINDDNNEMSGNNNDKKTIIIVISIVSGLIAAVLVSFGIFLLLRKNKNQNLGQQGNNQIENLEKNYAQSQNVINYEATSLKKTRSIKNKKIIIN